jgi:1-acyl-sn-glycerol-3-phosphate acyltransferase
METQFHRSILQRIYWTGAKLISRILLSIFTRRRVTGQENIPKQGSLLVVSNHLSFVDQFLISINLGRKTVFMAKMEVFKSRIIRHLAHGFGAFPVRRGGILDRAALQQANQILDSGQALVMFPEGARNRKAELRRAYPGSAMIALHNNVPILPIGITGMEHADAKSLLWNLFHRPRVTVTIGRPFHLPPVESKATKKDLLQLGDHIMEHIAELLPPKHQGYYAKRGE